MTIDASMGFQGRGIAHTPPICLEVIALVASSGGYAKGPIAQRVAHAWVAHWATQGGPAERTTHRHQQPVAHVWLHPGWCPRLPPRGCPHQAPSSDEGHPWRRTRAAQRHHGCRVPRDARPIQRSSLRLFFWLRQTARALATSDAPHGARRRRGTGVLVSGMYVSCWR